MEAKRRKSVAFRHSASTFRFLFANRDLLNCRDLAVRDDGCARIPQRPQDFAGDIKTEAEIDATVEVARQLGVRHVSGSAVGPTLKTRTWSWAAASRRVRKWFQPWRSADSPA
jgi:hypothetical protein